MSRGAADGTGQIPAPRRSPGSWAGGASPVRSADVALGRAACSAVVRWDRMLDQTPECPVCASRDPDAGPCEWCRVGAPVPECPTCQESGPEPAVRHHGRSRMPPAGIAGTGSDQIPHRGDGTSVRWRVCGRRGERVPSALMPAQRDLRAACLGPLPRQRRRDPENRSPLRCRGLLHRLPARHPLAGRRRQLPHLLGRGAPLYRSDRMLPPNDSGRNRGATASRGVDQ